jgi:hypothetical protein
LRDRLQTYGYLMDDRVDEPGEFAVLGPAPHTPTGYSSSVESSTAFVHTTRRRNGLRDLSRASHWLLRRNC